jgi:hypothetical protein
MRPQSNYFLSAVVWLTAVSTLGAGITNSICTCPNKSTECCINGEAPISSTSTRSIPAIQNRGCCQSYEPNKPPLRKSCCSRGEQDSYSPAPAFPSADSDASEVSRAQTSPTVGRQLCQRHTLAPKPQIVNKNERESDQFLSWQLESIMDPAPAATVPAEIRAWSKMSILPPTAGLPTLLQRLTI